MAVSKNKRKRDLKGKKKGVKKVLPINDVFCKISYLAMLRLFEDSFSYKSDNEDIENTSLDTLIEKVGFVQGLLLEINEDKGFVAQDIEIVKFINIFRDVIIVYKGGNSSIKDMIRFMFEQVEKDGLGNFDSIWSIFVVLGFSFKYIGNDSLLRRLIGHYAIICRLVIFKNKYIVNYNLKKISVENKIDIEYDKKLPILTIGDIKDAQEYLVNKNSFNYDFLGEMIRKLSYLLDLEDRITNNNNIAEILSRTSKVFYVDMKLEKLREEELLIAYNEGIVSGIMDRKKYAYGNQGVGICIKDSKFAKRVNIYEDMNRYLVELVIKNDGSIYKSNVRRSHFVEVFEKENVSKYDVESDEISVFVTVNKEIVGGVFLVKITNGTTINFGTTVEEWNDFKDCILEMALTSIFVAYCDHKYIKGITVAEVSKGSSYSHSYERDGAYRIAHIRKLPTGWNVSDNAKERAKANGIILPKGYTFVDFANSKLEKQKIIRI